MRKVKAQYLGDSAVVRYNGNMGVFRKIGVTTYIEVYDPLTGWTNCPVEFDTPLKIVKAPRDASREWVEANMRSIPNDIEMYCELLDEVITYQEGRWYNSEGTMMSMNQADELAAICRFIMNSHRRGIDNDS